MAGHLRRELCRLITSSDSDGESDQRYHSGFDPSDWPSWTNFVGENFRWHSLFLVKAKEKIINGLDQKIPQTCIGGVQVV